MACAAKLYIYSDLEGKPTGEFAFDCAGDCPDGSGCRKRVEKLGDYMRIGCSCEKALRDGYPDGTCSLILHVLRGADGNLRLSRQCSYQPCGDGPECRVCMVRSFGKSITVL